MTCEHERTNLIKSGSLQCVECGKFFNKHHRTQPSKVNPVDVMPVEILW